MELELGLKITHTRDDVTSLAELRIAKDHTGPLFLSRETETMFILVAYLRGFRRENIEIRINEEGNRITITGQKPVQELVLLGWFMHKKDVELRAFRKAFRIPDGIILDRIKAKFKDDEATLTIIMPKSVKGICGVGIEEVMEEEVVRGRPEAAEPLTDKAPELGYREPDTKKLEEIEQVVRKEIDRMEPEITRVLADEFPGKGKDEEELKGKSVEPKILGGEETDQVMEKVADQGKFVTDKAPELGQREPDTKKVEEIEQVVQKEIDIMEPEITRVIADEFPGKGKDEEELKGKSVEPKILGEEETDRVMEKVADQGKFVAIEEVHEMFHERENGKWILQEKFEKPKFESKEEETEKVLEENIDERESKKMQENGEVVPERVEDKRLKEKPDIEDQRVLEEDSPLKAEPPATTVTSQETATMEPKQAKPEKEIKQLTPPEETQSKRVSDLKEQEKKQVTPKVETVQEEYLEVHIQGPESNELTETVLDRVTNLASTQAEQEHATGANDQVEHNMPQEPKQQEPESNVQEPTKAGPDQENKQANTQHRADQTKNDDVHEIKKEDHEQENHGIASAIEEATDEVKPIEEATDEVKPIEEKVFDEHESPETEKKKDLAEGETKTKNPVSKRCNLCSPIVIAGSAILVSVIVLVFSWIRSKKR